MGVPKGHYLSQCFPGADEVFCWVFMLVGVFFERLGRGGMKFCFRREGVIVFFWMGWEVLF